MHLDYVNLYIIITTYNISILKEERKKNQKKEQRKERKRKHILAHRQAASIKSFLRLFSPPCLVLFSVFSPGIILCVFSSLPGIFSVFSPPCLVLFSVFSHASVLFSVFSPPCLVLFCCFSSLPGVIHCVSVDVVLVSVTGL